MHFLRRTLLCITAALLFTGCTTPVPTETEDGLVLRPTEGSARVYMKPGALFTGYDAYGIGKCDVSFKRNWLRDQNASRIDLSNRVTQQDVDRIRDALGAECDKYLLAALLEDPAYKLVESFSDGEAVLIVRPAIINLDVYAPDTRSATRQRSFTTSAGEMTLVIELIDGTTGEILVRAFDRQGGQDRGYIQWSNSVTNKAEADRILRSWARQMREGLDRAIASS